MSFSIVSNALQHIIFMKANTIKPYQTVTDGAVLSGSILFAI